MPRNGTARGRSIATEGLALLLIALGLYLFVCLGSYHPEDPGVFTRVEAAALAVRNLGGVVGAEVGSTLREWIGFAAFLLPIALLVGAAALLRGGLKTQGRWAWVGFPGLILTVAVLLAIRAPEPPNVSDAGGVIGGFLGGHALHYLSAVGSYLIVGALFLTFLMMTTGLSPVAFVARAGRLAAAGGARAAAAMGRARLRFRDWRVARRARREERARRRERERAAARAKAEALAAKANAEAAAEANAAADAEEDAVETAPRIRTSRVLEPAPESPPAAVGNGNGAALKIVPMAEEPKPAAPAARPKQRRLPFARSDEDYELPDLELLDFPEQAHVRIDEENLIAQARILEKKLLDLGVEGKVVEVHPGPVITMYEFEPAPGVKVSKIMGLQDDLALRLGGVSVRIIPTIPGKAVMGIEVPNSQREVVYLRELLASEEFQEGTQKLPLALGKDRSGRVVVADLVKMPHLLVAGSTGAGKSVCINAIICSLSYRFSPHDVNFIMVDPKRLELSIYDGIPHLLYPVVTDPKKAANALRWALAQMEERYTLMADMGVRSLESYNKNLPAFLEKLSKLPPPEPDAEDDEEPLQHRHLSKIVIIIDELADLMMVAGKDVEESITRLAQMARAAGIHLILATQRPSVDVITGLIKANFPARIAFKVAQKTDSRTILDQNGADALLGMGDMLFLPPGTSSLQRVHGAFVSDQDIQRVVEHLKSQGEPRYDASVVIDRGRDGEVVDEDDEDVDEKYDEAVALVSTMKTVSVSMLQRRMKIGYNRAARIIEKMERDCVVGPGDGAKPRQVLIHEI